MMFNRDKEHNVTREVLVIGNVRFFATNDEEHTSLAYLYLPSLYIELLNCTQSRRKL